MNIKTDMYALLDAFIPEPSELYRVHFLVHFWTIAEEDPGSEINASV
jgi:hypothetical protein